MSGPQLNEDEFQMWSEWLEDEYGLQFGPEKRTMLRTRLEPRRAALGMESYEQLLFHLKFHPSRRDERERLIPHLTNNESYFCREPGSLAVLRDELLPRIRAEVKGETIRLLSAACSTGEEAYTLAITALEAGLRPGELRVTAVDVDHVALDRARAGRYGPHAFRSTDDAFRRRWFTQVGEETWEIRPEIRASIDFACANLADPAWSSLIPRQHVVFCRNVLIYFGDEAVARAALGLYDALLPGGYLFLGHAESLRHVPLPFAFVRRPGALFYRREEA